MKLGYAEIYKQLKSESIETWFDLGLFLDRLKERKPSGGINVNYFKFKEKLVRGGVGFLSFYYGVDGITVETTKYIAALRRIIPGLEIHLIAGLIKSEADNIFDDHVIKYELPHIKSFDDWSLYKYFFKIKLERGSKEYNQLIKDFWKEVLLLTNKLAKYIQENNIEMIWNLNVNSNPGNISLALATVLISEYMGIPVINNCHDYYWEDGNKPIDIKLKRAKAGFRDFFFTNSDIGEVFSVIEVLYPWESRSWITVNINRIQQRYIIENKGHNPANVALLGTSVNSEQFQPLSKRESINTLKQVGRVFQNRVYDIDHVLKNKITFLNKPFIAGNSLHKNFNIVNNNVVFLQPTRVIKRKRIETNFELVGKLFRNKSFQEKFEINAELKLTVIVSGPIASGHNNYFFQILESFKSLLEELQLKLRDRVFLGFLFSALDREDYIKQNDKHITIPDLYAASSMILLPSDTEGRGLPIVESAAAGKPIFIRRYEPQEVFAEVKGEHLDESLRLQVIEFKERISERIVQQVITKIFYPQDSIAEIIHNKNVIAERFNIDKLQNNLDKILYQTFLQLKSLSQSDEKINRFFMEYESLYNRDLNNFTDLMDTSRREYLPGFNRLRFMILLKSLIDPSFFRTEEQLTKGKVYSYAIKILSLNNSGQNISREKYHEFFNIINDIFFFSDGELSTRYDHSFPYRHRNRKNYVYQNYTYQELTGLINLIFDDIIDPHKTETKIFSSDFFFSDWNLALIQLTGSHSLGIDNRNILFKKLKEPVPRIYYPGKYLKFEMELFVLQPIRAILNLKIEEELTEEILKENLNNIPTVYLFINKYHLYNPYFFNHMKSFLESTHDRELNLLYKYELIQLVKTKQYCVGFHMFQFGDKELDIMRTVKKENGFLITNGQSAAVMTDILDLDRFHIGRIKREIISKMMGIPIGYGFIQFVPASVRTIISYPTPIQTSKDFNEALQSKKFKKLSASIGETELFQLIRKDSKLNSTPIKTLLKNIESNLSEKKKKSYINPEYISGVYKDMMPWSGVIAELDTKSEEVKWRFAANLSIKNPKPVTEQVTEFQNKMGVKPRIAWNGGYILNPELVGKLGLPQNYIGSPLGLLIINKKIVSPPLFNKPSFIIYENGDLEIETLNLEKGISISRGGDNIEFEGHFYNKHSDKYPCYYDLNNDFDEIEGKGNIIVHMAGSIVKEIIKTGVGEKIKLIPAGLTLSIPENLFNKKIFIKNQHVKIIPNFDKKLSLSKIKYAVEAGPMLVNNGKVSIDMKKEGWKSLNSIKTQAARMDFTDMRGPKIALGLNSAGKLIILAVNGRIRESVGATHTDMAEILISKGAEKAMGFDPGGSTTLVVGKKQLNISPYNKKFEEDIYSLAPEARFVSNSIIGWIEK